LASPAPAWTISIRTSPTAISRLSLLRSTVNPQPSITRIGVSRLFARRAMRSRSNVMSRSPAMTFRPTLTCASKPSPPSPTVSIPMCMRISAPASLRSVTACLDSGRAMICPSQGACSVALVGSTASPSPNILPAKTGSGISSSGVLQHASGASRTRRPRRSVARMLRRALRIEVRDQRVQQAVPGIILTQDPDHHSAQVLPPREVGFDAERERVVVAEEGVLAGVVEPGHLRRRAPVTHPGGAREELRLYGLPGSLRKYAGVLRVEAVIARRDSHEAASIEGDAQHDLAGRHAV